MVELSARVERLTLDLVRIPSVNGTVGELEIVRFIHRRLAANAYFRKYPERLRAVPLEGDGLGRSNLFALVRGEGAPSTKAVILHGHIDTVGVADYGLLEPWAFDPHELATRMVDADLPKDAREDLASGEWLFGRGTADMKAGVAAHICVLEDLIARVQQWSGNVLFMANPVEENQHTGIIQSLKFLEQLRAEEGLDFVAALNNDCTSPAYPGDPKRYVYTGAVGKLLPSFYITGAETHVGQGFGGFNPALLAAELVRRVELNPDMCDEAEGEVSGPPVVLKAQDLKIEYTVQTPGAAFVYANYFTHDITTDRVVEQLVGVTREAAEAVTQQIEENHERYCARIGKAVEPLGWKVKVVPYTDLYRRVEEKVGPGLQERLRKLTEELLRGGTDFRVVCLRVVEEVRGLDPDKTPTVVLFFAPPYCPHNFVRGRTEREGAILAAVNQVVREHVERTGEEMVARRFFPMLSDSSYLTMDDSDASVAALIENFPQWYQVYPLPVEQIRRSNIPALNLGAYGKDVHQWTERVHRPYSFDVLPRLTLRAIELLLALQ